MPRYTVPASLRESGLASWFVQRCPDSIANPGLTGCPQAYLTCTAPNAVRCTTALAGGARECPVATTADWFNGSMGIPVMDPAIHGF
jgi:hypothetical protein